MNKKFEKKKLYEKTVQKHFSNKENEVHLESSLESKSYHQK